MPLQIVRNDITKMQTDAIVNSTDEVLSGSGGTDLAIHRAAGPGLAEECRAIGGIRTGEAVVTDAYDLPARYVIHTAGPRWEKSGRKENAMLKKCYARSLELAYEKGCGSIAFPLISSGTFRYPKELALKTATGVISDFLLEHDMDVYLVVFDKNAYQISSSLFSNVQAYIDDHYVEAAHRDASKESTGHGAMRPQARPDARPDVLSSQNMPPAAAPKQSAPAAPGHSAARRRSLLSGKNAAAPVFSEADKGLYLAEAAAPYHFELDESFSEMLLRLIDERKMTDVECYKRANIDKKLFSKIRSNPMYAPSKTTALAFAVALKLDLSETEELLRKAGYSLSHSQMLDVIVEYFIKKKKYDIFSINEVLFEYDQKLLGSR